MTSDVRVSRMRANPMLIAVIAVLALAVYVASVGPVYRFAFWYERHSGTREFPTAIRVAYRPVFAICRLEPMGQSLAWYLNLWGSDFVADYWPPHGIVFREG